ncbi:MAG: acetylornithine deacetylase [Betaproteobacteria bacterium]|nr:MAG: acetylornithine deacetylase [Betaproteobacteria bacterium]
MSAPSESVVDALASLVGFSTVSRESNLQLIEWARSRLEGVGARCRLTYDAERRKANLFASLGPDAPGGVVLSGHTDVVPVEGQRWDTDPFRAELAGDRVYGRGTADMKGFVATALALAPEFVAHGLRQPLHFALSYDEEVGCIGVRGLIADLAQARIRPATVIVGEPTSMRVVIGHKGKHGYRCTVRGLACHSAYAPQGVNAVEAAAEIIAYLKGMARRFRDQGPFDALYDIAHTTVHTGVIQGGTALNIVPKECSFDFEFRHLPGDDPNVLIEEVKRYAEGTLLPEMQRVDPNSGFAWDVLSVMPGLDVSAESEAARLALALTDFRDVGKVSYGTEASLFQQAGIPAVVCGPGSIEQAHKPNEYVSLDQLAQCEAFLRRLMDRVCG